MEIGFQPVGVAGRIHRAGGRLFTIPLVSGPVSFFKSGAIGVLAVFLASTGLAQTTNTVTNGGTINVGVTEIITNTVTSPMSAAITNNGSLQFWQTTALTVSGAISGSGTVTKATGSGNLTLSGPNTFSGKVTISSGRLDATGVSDSAGSGLGQGTQVELGSGANLQVTVGAGTTNTTTRALILNGSGTLGASTGTLVWNGNVTNNGTAASTFMFNSPAAGANVFGGIIGNTTNNSAVSLDFQNTQIWSLTGNNTFTGLVTISNGRLIVDKLASNGVASSVGAGTTIRFGGFTGNAPVLEYVGSGSTNNKQFKMGGGGNANTGGTILNNGTGALEFNNTTFNAAGDALPASSARALTLSGTNEADNTISGVIQNNNANNTVSIVKDGTGKWVLSGNSTYTGGTTISNGILQIGAGGTSGSVLGAITNNGTLILSRSGNPTISNVISGTGALINSNGSVTLSGANTFGGKVTVVGGTLNASGVSDTVGSGLGLGREVELVTVVTPTATNYPTLNVAVGSGSNNSTTRLLAINGGAVIANGGSGSLVWDGDLVATTTFSASELRFNSAGTGTNVFAGTIQESIDAAVGLSLNFQNTQIWSLTGNNTFSGGITIGGGKVIVDKLADSGMASSLGQGAAAIRFGGFSGAAPVLEYTGPGSINNKQFKLGGGGNANTGGTILNNGTGPLEFYHTTFNPTGDGLPASSTRALSLGGANAADNIISGVIGDNNANNTVSVVKDGAGKWILSGANTYSGGTTISNGILQIGAGGSSGQLGSGNVTNNGTLAFHRTGSLTVSNAISGAGDLTNIGSGTVTLSGANTFSGNVTVGGGTLAVSSVADTGSSSLGTGTQVALGGSATVSFTANSANTTTRSLVLGGTGGNALKNSGSGALVWSGNVVNNMTANGADLSLAGSGTGGNEFAGLLTNNGTNSLRLIKNETGTWKVSGANTFTGYMDVFNGTLQATTIANSGTPSSLGAGTTIRFGGWAGSAPVLEYVGSGTTNNKQFKLGGGGTAATGGTILNNGTGALVFNNPAFNATGDGGAANINRALTLGGSSTADNTISGVIIDNTNFANSTVSIVKADAGKWILSGANKYTGSTTVNGGTLVIVRTNLTANITPSSIAINFSNTNNGTFPVLYGGPLAGSGYSGVVMATTGLNPNQTATFDATTGTVTVASTATPPTITSTDAFTGTVGLAFSTTATATGDAPITFSAVNLPGGLSMATNGVITGTPTAAGTFNSTFTAINAAGTNNQSVTFTIANATPSDSSFAGWRGANAPSADLLLQYAYGAASASNAVSQSNLPSLSLSNSNLVLTYYVRKNATNPNLVIPQLHTNLADSNGWGNLPSNNIAEVGTNQVNGVDVLKKTATVPIDTTNRKFLRLKISE